VIAQVTDSATWASLTTGAWCYYNNDPANGKIYGKLYNWYAVNDLRGLAPQGWHIPNDTDWNRLLKFLDPSSDTLAKNAVQSTSAGGSMKEKGTTHWLTPNTGATNVYGFDALPSGLRNGKAIFDVNRYVGIWWSSSAYSATIAWTRSTFNDNTNVSKLNAVKSIGLAIRLVKD
jgi:uncharacterized protein (TIGR02145 family)